MFAPGQNQLLANLSLLLFFKDLSIVRFYDFKKNLKNKIKKFLTKQKASDIINELSAERRRQTTLITKQ